MTAIEAPSDHPRQQENSPVDPSRLQDALRRIGLEVEITQTPQQMEITGHDDNELATRPSQK